MKKIYNFPANLSQNVALDIYKSTDSISDEDILSMEKVTPAVAAKYLGMTAVYLRKCIETGRLDFGVCEWGKGSKRVFHINPQRLVMYKRGELGSCQPNPAYQPPKKCSEQSCKSKTTMIECNRSDSIAFENGGKKEMKRKNGNGCIKKWGGNRSKPYGAFAPGYTDNEGRYIQKYLGSFKTEEEARRVLLLYAAGEWGVPSDITLKTLFDEWKKTAYDDVSQSTIDGYNAAWKHFASIQNKKVVDLKLKQFQDCVNACKDRGYSYSSLHKMKVLAVQLEKYAVDNDIINKNYASSLKLPKKDLSEKEIFSDEHFLIIQQAAEEGIGVADVIMIMCYTGWRINELLNLKPEDYDPQNRTLRGGLKTKAGKDRIVPVPDKVMPYLQKWLDKGGVYIFCSSQGGGHMIANTLRKEFKQTLAQIGVHPETSAEFTPHATRHSYISLLNRIGVDTKTIMKLGGHSDVITSIGTYTHTNESQHTDAANKLSNLKFGVQE